MLKNFKKIIRECEYSELSLFDIALKMFKYYWDQTIFFNLFQSAPNQPPVILTEVKRIIALYKENIDEFRPIVFERVISSFDNNLNKELNKSIRRSVSNIKVNVMPFFLNLNSIKYNFYQVDKVNNKIIIKTSFLKELYYNQEDLFDLINYRWSMMLENYNSCPRIAKKVRIMDEQIIDRKSLKIFDKFLDLENDKHICFICGKEIKEHELSRDHVIPWSYMYSDDLWNIVYVHKGCNSSKSNITPSQEVINNLKERNNKLKELLHIKYENRNLKLLQEFDYAIENDFVDKFYLGCRGC